MTSTFDRLPCSPSLRPCCLSVLLVLIGFGCTKLRGPSSAESLADAGDAAGPDVAGNVAEPADAGERDAAEPGDAGVPGLRKLNRGESCADDRQCATGSCVNSVCCTSPTCAGPCQACNIPGASLGECTAYDDSDGLTGNDAPSSACSGARCMGCNGISSECVAVPEGADWRDHCVEQPLDSCGNSGVCNGTAECARYGSDTPCDDGLYCNGSDNCDGSGSCTVHSGDPCSGGNSCNVCSEAVDSCQNVDTYYDAEADLTWERSLSTNSTMTFDAARAYCDALTRCSRSDWSLPTITELRQLIRGCHPTGTFINDVCLVTNNTSSTAFRNGLCDGCTHNAGPDDGCYWPEELEGTCSFYWSSTAAADDDSAGWIVRFDDAFVDWIFKDAIYRVRCVHTGN